MRKTREDILKVLGEHRKEIRSMGVRHLGLFGSVARGESTASSDLDFLVDFEKKSFDAYMELKFFLEDLFSMSVDLVMQDTLKERLKETILKENIRAPGL